MNIQKCICFREQCNGILDKLGKDPEQRCKAIWRYVETGNYVNIIISEQ